MSNIRDFANFYQKKQPEKVYLKNIGDHRSLMGPLPAPCGPRSPFSLIQHPFFDFDLWNLV